MKKLKEELEGYLAENNSWNSGCPGLPGKNYQESMKVWEVKKLITLRKMVKDLEELEAVDNETATMVRSIIAREIAVSNWQASCGTYPIWASIFSKAKGRAKKQLTGKSDFDNFSEGMFKNAKATQRRSAVSK